MAEKRVIHQFTADLAEKSWVDRPVLVQNTDNRFIIDIVQHGAPVDLSDVQDVVLASQPAKRNERPVSVLGSVSGDSQVTVDLGRSEIAHPGVVQAQLKLLGADGGTISTTTFQYQVERDVNADSVPTETERTLIETVLADGPQVIERANDAASLAESVAAQNETHFRGVYDTVADRDAAIPDPGHGDTATVADESTGISVTYRYIDATVDDAFSESYWEETDRVYNPSAIRQLNQQLADTVEKTGRSLLSVPPSSLSNVKVTENYSGVLPIGKIRGTLYGVEGNTTIVKSNSRGETWVPVTNSPLGSPHTILQTDDGEVIIVNPTNVVKSTGWADGSPTWETKLTISVPGSPGILPWGIDGDGKKFIATEYSSGTDRSQSRYVWISTDAGNSWNVVLDKYQLDPENTSHMHAVCYDKWGDRFWVSHGHGVLMGTYWSGDNGASWNKLNGNFQPDAAPTTLCATYNGIVCGSDSQDAGLYGIARTKDPMDMELKPIAKLHTDDQGVKFVASRSSLDEETGHVYVSFKSENGETPAIMAGSATTGALVWKSDEIKGMTRFLNFEVIDGKIFGVVNRVSDSVNFLVTGSLSPTGTNSFDSGNITGGYSENPTSIAIGKNVNIDSLHQLIIGMNAGVESEGSTSHNTVIGHLAKSKTRGVALGYGAESLSDDTISIGYNTKIGSNSGGTQNFFAISIGSESKVYNEGSIGAVAIGRRATSARESVSLGMEATAGSPGQTNSVAIGKGANSGSSGVSIGAYATSGTYQVAIGRDAKTTGTGSVSIGRGAETGFEGVAIGQNAKSNSRNSVALGNGSETSSPDQLQIGNRHIELKKVAEPLNVPDDTGRIFVMDDGAGNLNLCVRLGGKTTVLASEV